MNLNKSVLLGGSLMIGLAVVLRILLTCFWGDVLTYPEWTEEPVQQVVMQETAITQPIRQPSPLRLSAADVQIKYSCSKQPDVEALLAQPLEWDLVGEEPTVLIFHTHGTEAFTPVQGAEYQEVGGKYRTTDDTANMISVGEELARLLRAVGIRVIHDCNHYDLDYEKAYSESRKAVQKHLKEYPSIRLVIDLHRDAITGEDGAQIPSSGTVCGEKAARVMLVMGTDSRSSHPNWEQNLSLALKLHGLMEGSYPGITRPLDLRKQRFNQDLSVGAILAEIGTAGNTHEEAMKGVSVLAEAIIRMTYEMI